MGTLVVDATAAQAQPEPNRAVGPFLKGTVYIQAVGQGSGTWSAVFNVAPVSPGGVVGSVRQYTVTNSVPMVDADVQTGASLFIGWWTGFVGTVTYVKGSVDG